MPDTFSIQSSGFAKVTLNHDIKNSFDKRSVTTYENWGELLLNEIWFNGIGLCYWRFDAKQPYLIDVEADRIEFVKGFVLNGNATLNADNCTATIDNGTYYTCGSSAVTHRLSFQKSATMLAICFEKSAIEKLRIESLHSRSDIFGDGLTVGKYCSTPIESIINEITKAIQAKPVKRIYLEAKLLELLSLQLEQGLETHEDLLGLSETDIERLHDAKLIVEQNLQMPCSLIELARKTGLNDFKLKKGFKALFGTTVFGHLNELRMEQAYTLLTNNATVGYVSEIIGYKNAQHFTVAFKKRFGLLPSQVSRNKG